MTPVTRRIFPVCVWVLAGTIGLAEPVSNLHLAFGPDPATTMTVSWRAAGKCEFELVGQRAQAQVTLSATGSDYRARLQGLGPGQPYQYRIQAGGASAGGTFATAPADAAAFSFAVLGDVQGMGPSAKWQRTADWLTGQRPAFFLPLGDLVEHGLIQTEWDNFFADGAKLFATTPVEPIIGNHDCYRDRYPELKPQLFLDQFAVPPNGVPGYNGYWYSFDYGAAHFVGLCNFPVGGPVPMREAAEVRQTLWLQHDLAATAKPWKFVFFHVPIYSSGPHGDATRYLARIWGRIFDATHVTVVFSGHTHAFETTQPIRAGHSAAAGTTYYNCAGINYSAVATGSWFTVKAQPRERMLLPAIVTVGSNAVTITTYDLEAGVVFDELRLEKNAN